MAKIFLSVLLFLSIGGIHCQYLKIMSFLEDLPKSDTRFVSLRRAVFLLNTHHNKTGRPHTILEVHPTGVSEPAVLIRKWCLKIEVMDSFVGQLALSTLHTMKDYAHAFRVPFVIFNLAPTDFWDDFRSDYLISIKPPIIPVVQDVVAYHGWTSYAYIFDSDESFLRFANYMQKVPSHRILSKRIIQTNMTSAEFALEGIQEAEMTKIIVDCHHIMTEVILNLLANRDMVTAAYHYIFLDMDINLADFPTLGGMTLTGFNMVDRNNDNFSYAFDKWKDKPDLDQLAPENKIIGYDASLAFDSVIAVAEGYEEPEVRGSPPRCNPDFQRSKFGVTYAKRLKNVTFSGITGPVAFSESGARTNYSVDVLSLHANQMKKIGHWSTREGLMINETMEQALHSDTSGRVYRVVSVLTYMIDQQMHLRHMETVQYQTCTLASLKNLARITSQGEPYFSRKIVNGTEVEDEYEGFCVDLLREIKTILATRNKDFNYTWHVVADGNFGAPTKKHGKWDGMVGEIIDGKADLAVASLTISKKRQEVVDFTKPFMDFGISIMLKTPEDVSHHFDFLGPFSFEIWICLFFALIGITLTLFEVSRFSESEWYTQSENGEDERINEFGFFNSMWYAIGSIMQQGAEYSPRSLAGRIVGGVCWFFTLIILASYTANLAAFLTMQRLNTPIKSSADLAKQTEVVYGTKKAGTTPEFFRDSTIPTFQTMWEFMYNKEPSPFAANAEEGWKKVWQSEDGKYAYILESTTNNYYNQKKPCKTMAVQEKLSSSSYGIAVSKSLKELTKDLTLAILELREKAQINLLENKWWREKGECGEQDKVVSKSGTHALTLEQLAGLFYILLGGLMSAVIITLVHIVKKTIAQEQINMSRFTSLRFFQSLWNTGGAPQPAEKKSNQESPRTPTISTGSSSRDTAPLTLKIPREVTDRSRMKEPIPTTKRSYRGY